jgi:acetyl-CoA carboxylase biotin carboxyl carrier protein
MSDDESGSDERSDLDELSTFVERLTLLVQKSGLTSLQIKTDDIKVKIRAGEAESPVAVAVTPAPDSQIIAEAMVTELTGSVISAPMVGTFYHATSPSEPPLVQVGDRVEIGQVVGIIEAMKIMNEIASDRNGLVAEIIAPNGTAVEYGSPLIRVAP